MFRFLVPVLVVFLGLSCPAESHEIKALASRLVVDRAGEKTTVYLSWGHRLPVDDLVDGSTLERYELVAPGGKVTPLKPNDLSLQAQAVQLEDEGVHQVVVQRRAGVFTYVEDDEGNRLMKRGPRTGIKQGKIDYAFRSQQFARTMIVVGSAKEKTIEAVGLPLEIVPVEGPSAWKTGATLHFRVLLHGKPLSSETLLATYVGFRPDNAWCYATSTGQKGTAGVHVHRPGTWVFKVRVKKAAPAEVRKEYDVETYTSTLTLEIQP